MQHLQPCSVLVSQANNEDSLTSRTYGSQLLLTTSQLMKSLFLKNLPKTFSLFISCRNRPVEITMMSLEPEPLSFWPAVVFDTVIATKQQLMLTTSINPSGTFQRQSLMTAAASSRRSSKVTNNNIKSIYCQRPTAAIGVVFVPQPVTAVLPACTGSTQSYTKGKITI